MSKEDTGQFVADGDPADIAVVVVTYNSADDIDGLIASLRADAAELRLRVIIADNSSNDTTTQLVAAHDDVALVPTGGNRGYAAGINAAMQHVGTADAILILNPDLRVSDGAIQLLKKRLDANPALGIVVPRILDEDGTTSTSLRREPSLLRATADALFGRRWLTRPAALSEYIREPSAYESNQIVEWATGAALLIRRQAADQIGAWDEHFFLYSEETDFFRRARAAGWTTLYESAAYVTHKGGGSGVSIDLVALTVINRVRYMEKYHPATAPLYRGVVMLGEALRQGDETHTRARWALRRRSRWSQLPGPSWDALPVESFPGAAVIIPAHNEAAVIARTLQPLSALAEAGRIELIVTCNGCTDETADRAKAISGATVIEVPEASKIAALNAGDAVATRWPRVYLDADVTITPRALADVIRCLDSGEAMAARPVAIVDTSNSSAAVHRYYRARERMPSMAAHLWGAGVYALSAEGHERLGVFPDVIADDFYVDSLFTSGQKTIVRTDPVVVQAPRDGKSLLAVFTRARRGPAQQGADTGAASVRELLRTIRGPQSAWDAATFAWFAVRARLEARRIRNSSASWERDDSSRQVDVDAPDRSAVDHVIVTRFNLPTPGPEALIRAQEGWLRNRVELFERYTVPSIRAQSRSNFTWVIYFDSESPDWLRERLAPFVEEGLILPFYREEVTWEDVARDAREVTLATGDILLTTNLDNDDAVAVDFVERLQDAAVQHHPAAIFLRHGLIVQGDDVYLRDDPENAFCSVAESWDQPLTAWRDWHSLLRKHFRVVSVPGAPAWMQVIHGQNVSNRVHGKLVSSLPYRALFPGLLERVPELSTGDLLRDRMLRRPVRAGVKTARTLGKNVFLAVFGKDRLDGLKEWIQGRRDNSPD